MSLTRPGHAIGFDDAPFSRQQRSRVQVVGAVYAGHRLDGVVSDYVRRDGRNATEVLTRLVRDSKFHPQLDVVFLQGIALAGFNVVDIAALHRAVDRPVLVVARRRPNLRAIQQALEERVPGGARKWRLIEQAGPMEPVGEVFVQRAGLSLSDAARMLARWRVHGNLPEPLRAAHLIAGGVTTGQSRGRA